MITRITSDRLHQIGYFFMSLLFVMTRFVLKKKPKQIGNVIFFNPRIYCGKLNQAQIIRQVFRKFRK